jgi:PAS domain S-box-containing protein
VSALGSSMKELIPIPATYDYRLVALSVVIAVCASYVAFDLTGRVTANRGCARLAWLLGGAFAMGSGIWSMHYTGMLALRLPIPVYYHVPTVMLSLLAAVLASLIALYVVSRQHVTPLGVAVGSLLVGAGIATMHFTGMAAMRLGAMHHYRSGLWMFSVFLAVIISAVALILIFHFRNENRGWKIKVLSALLMGLAIPVMHYTGMAAVIFVPTMAAANLTHSVDISALASAAILVVTFVILGSALLTSLVDRRISAQQILAGNERRMLRALIDNIPDFMYVKDEKSRFVVANSCLAHAVGVESPEELLGKTDFDLFPRELANQFYEGEQMVIHSGQPVFNREETCLDGVGNTIHILTTKVPLRDSEGRVTGIAGVGRDISDRKVAEAAVRTAHRQAEVFIDAVPSILIGLDHDSRITRWNLTAARVFGLSGAEVAGKRLADCGVKWLRPGMRDEIRSWCSEPINRRSDSIPFELNGETRLLGLTITVVCTADSNSKELLVIGSDVTEREKARDALQEAERKYRGIFDNAIFGIFQSTPGGRYLSVNPAMARILGYDSAEEMIATLSDISRQMYVDPKRRDEFIAVMDKLGIIQNFECEVFRKDGSRVWIASSARAICQDGVVIRYEGMSEDITEGKLLRGQLLQAQKLESVGQLAAGIAHEINTPTQYIGDNVRFLKDAFQDLSNLLANYEKLLAAAQANTLSPETVQEVAAAVERADAGYLLEEIPKAIAQTVEGITRVSKLVSAMKEFSHPGTKEKIPLDLNHAIDSTITVARNEWKYVADLETEFDPSLPLISCQPGEFNQVILNLVVNAAHAIGEVTGKGGAGKGRIKVQTRNYPDWVEIRIQDTGSGIPEKARARVFDPFFTTKEIGKGTGQGLAIARSVVVDRHSGTIHFETEEGTGTTFIIRLPHDGKALAATASS